MELSEEELGQSIRLGLLRISRELERDASRDQSQMEREQRVVGRLLKSALQEWPGRG